MLTQPRCRRRQAVSRAAGAVLLLAMSVSACDKVPLLAPTGTVITLFPTATTVPLNGEVEIVATVIENGVTAAPPTTGTGGTPTTPTPTATTSTAGAGTPVQNGTLVSFTTTIGRIEPSEARTNNGQVRVKFIAGAESGNATITAFSGGASGKVENLLVGTAAAERIILTASPQTLGASGGTSVVSARVENTAGAGVPGVSVNFTADAGTLSAASALTDSNGVASIALTTTRKSTVTASVAGKTATVAVDLNPRTGITITAPTTAVAAGAPASFTIGVNASANIRNVTVNWGDGRTTSLGALSASTSVTHVFEEEGTFTVTATATDASGFSEPASTVVTVVPQQPPQVTLTAPSTARAGEAVSFLATVSGNTSSIQQFVWDFGDGVTAVTTSPRVSHVYTPVRTTTFTVSVTANQASGPPGQTLASLVVTVGGSEP